MSKNKGNKGKDKGSATQPEGGALEEASTSVPRAPRKARSPLGPLPVRLCEKADKVHKMASDVVKQVTSRGAPQSVCEAATAFLAQVETWRDVFFSLKTTGWEPSSKTVKEPIVEGDKIQIMPEHLARYSFIEGLAEGNVKLVAGSVEAVNKMLVQVMLKGEGEGGKFYGYCPRQYLTKRSA